MNTCSPPFSRTVRRPTTDPVSGSHAANRWTSPTAPGSNAQARAYPHRPPGGKAAQDRSPATGSRPVGRSAPVARSHDRTSPPVTPACTTRPSAENATAWTVHISVVPAGGSAASRRTGRPSAKSQTPTARSTHCRAAARWRPSGETARAQTEPNSPPPSGKRSRPVAASHTRRRAPSAATTADPSGVNVGPPAGEGRRKATRPAVRSTTQPPGSLPHATALPSGAKEIGGSGPSGSGTSATRLPVSRSNTRTAHPLPFDARPQVASLDPSRDTAPPTAGSSSRNTARPSARSNTQRAWCSPPPARTRLPSGLNRRRGEYRAGPPARFGTANRRTLPVARSRIWMAPSDELTASDAESGEKRTRVTWPPGPSIVPRNLPVSASNSPTVPLRPAWVATVRPSGARVYIHPRAGSSARWTRRRSRPVVRSQVQTARSNPAVTAVRPSGRMVKLISPGCRRRAEPSRATAPSGSGSP